MKNRKIVRQINRVVRDMHEKYETISKAFLMIMSMVASS